MLTWSIEESIRDGRAGFCQSRKFKTFKISKKEEKKGGKEKFNNFGENEEIIKNWKSLNVENVEETFQALQSKQLQCQLEQLQYDPEEYNAVAN